MELDPLQPLPPPAARNAPALRRPEEKGSRQQDEAC